MKRRDHQSRSGAGLRVKYVAIAPMNSGPSLLHDLMACSSCTYLSLLASLLAETHDKQQLAVTPRRLARMALALTSKELRCYHEIQRRTLRVGYTFSFSLLTVGLLAFLDSLYFNNVSEPSSLITTA